MFIFLPSTKPVSFSPLKKAAIPTSEFKLGSKPARTPITLRGSCARAGDTHAAAPPRREMNSRRLMGLLYRRGLHPTTSLKIADLRIIWDLGRPWELR